MFVRSFAAAALAFAVLAAPAQALHIDRFVKFTNDGVYTLSEEQAEFLGAPDADRIGFLRLRSHRTQMIAPGDTFDAASVLEATRNDDRIDLLLNGLGTEAHILYTGDAYDPLGHSEFVSGQDVRSAVALLFSSEAGNIVFTGRGTTTFNGGQTRGDFLGLPIVAPDPGFGAERGTSAVPLPAAGWLLIAGLGGLAAARRLRRAA